MNASQSWLLVGARCFDVGGDLEATAVLLGDGRIQALGTPRELRQRAPGAREVDLRGAVLLPALTDTHTHFFEWARRGAGVDLSECRSFEALERWLHRAAEELEAEPEWIGGSGWDPFFYGQPERFTRNFLDAIFGTRPVALEARDFHTLWCNTAALQRAGVSGPHPVEVPRGGSIGRDASGEPNGLLYETAWDLVRRARPPESDAVADRWLDRAQARAHELGITGVHCMEPMSTLAHYRRRAREGKAGLRICFHTPLDDLDARIERGERSYEGDDAWLRLGGVKVFMDGSLGSRTAAMHAPYPDGGRGTLLLESAELDEILARAKAAGIAGTVHAIGDRTVRIVAEAFARAREGDTLALAHRMEHAQCVPPAEVALLAAHGIDCAMQPVHLEDDLAVLDREWGAAAAHAYPLRSLVDAGVRVGLGSDAPVADPDPRRGIFAAIARRSPGAADRVGFHPEQSLEVHEALAGYTTWAAALARDEERGRIAVGRRADLTAIDDVRAESADAWLQARVRCTFVDGVMVHEALDGTSV